MKRKRQKRLVAERFEQVPVSWLEHFQQQIRDKLHKRHGIYALYNEDDLYYVGLAQNLRGRILRHQKDRHAGRWDSMSLFLTRSTKKLSELESLVLRIADPPGNHTKGTPLGQDMMKELEKEVTTDARWKYKIAKSGRKRRRKKKRREKSSNGLFPPQRLRGGRAQNGGWKFKARLRRDGSVRFRGKIFDKPSAAAKAATKWPTANGWDFWHYKDKNGDWLPIKKLRKR